MLRIKDIMTRNVYTVEPGASAEEAAWGLTRRHIGGAPARDADGNLVGVLSSSISSIQSQRNGSAARQRSVT